MGKEAALQNNIYYTFSVTWNVASIREEKGS